MDFPTLRAHLDREFRHLRPAVAAAPADERVPTCPDWTAQDLGYHVAEVYLHKAESIRRNARPEPWPPARPDMPAEEALDLAYAELTAQLDAHSPADPAHTWHGPDQTVGFWIRRMAQETLVHRVDAEFAAGLTPDVIAPIDAALALDGIDELLVTFIAYASATWPEDFGPLLTEADPRPVGLVADDRHLTVTVAPKGVEVAESSAEEVAACAARISAPDAGTLLLWLWNRLDADAVTASGDAALLAQFHKVRIAATQ